ncbi:MAG: DUF308 domain-containing protein [Clostridia bacterium]|nr:DUF308 domain-containing protein [Clostridia bacterium]
MKRRTCWIIIKTVLYLVAGALIILCREEVLRHIPYVVGGVMLAYGWEDVLVCACARSYESGRYSLFDGLVTIVLAVIMIFFASGDMTKCLVIWGVWSVLREGRELSEGVKALGREPLAIPNMAESAVVLVLSAILIVESVEHHARIHIVLLGIELMLEVLFPILNRTWENIARARRRAKEDDRRNAGPAAGWPDGTEGGQADAQATGHRTGDPTDAANTK